MVLSVPHVRLPEMLRFGHEHSKPVGYWNVRLRLRSDTARLTALPGAVSSQRQRAERCQTMLVVCRLKKWRARHSLVTKSAPC
jgi:hypothetical protein